MPAKPSNPALKGLFALAAVGILFLAAKYISDRVIPDVPGVVLTDMSSIEDLRSRFNADQGTPRLVLLLSPT